MSRVRASAAFLCALGLLIVAAGSEAQVRPKETTNTALTGEIKAIDAAQKTLTIEGANKEGGVYQVTGKNVATYIEVVDTP